MEALTLTQQAVVDAELALAKAQAVYEAAVAAMVDEWRNWNPFDLTGEEAAAWHELTAAGSDLVDLLSANSDDLATIAALAAHKDAAKLEQLVKRVIRGTAVAKTRGQLPAQLAAHLDVPQAHAATPARPGPASATAASEPTDRQASRTTPEARGGDLKKTEHNNLTSSLTDIASWERPAEDAAAPEAEQDDKLGTLEEDDDGLEDMFSEWPEDGDKADGGQNDELANMFESDWTQPGDGPDWLKSFKTT